MIKIEENHEPLVDLRKACPQLVIKFSRKTLPEEKTAYLRRTAARKLNQAQSFLPKGMTLVVGDAWRPPAIQKKIHVGFIKRFRKQQPSWSEKRIIQEAEKYAAPWQGKEASGHLTGGAVDLRLWKNGRKLPMKSGKLSYQENARSFQPRLPGHLQANRQLMFDALAKAGFVNDAGEFWHWSYGDYYWAKKLGRKRAFYGVIGNDFKGV